MRTNFTELQIRTTGSLPFIQREGEYSVALKAIDTLSVEGINKEYAKLELGRIKASLKRAELDWDFYRGRCLGVAGNRVYSSLVPYVLQEKLGRVYRVDIEDIVTYMRILHTWKYHGVTMARLDKELSDYGLNDEVSFGVFKKAIDTMWLPEPTAERVIYRDVYGYSVSIYNTRALQTSGMRATIDEAIELSSYETMSQHIVSSMMELPKSVVLLGASTDSCYVLDTTGRNELDIVKVFSDLVFPRWVFSRYIKFTGQVSLVESFGLLPGYK